MSAEHVLLVSDPHIHPHKRKIERLEDCLKAVEWAFQTAIDRNIENVLFGGDLFHDRQKIESFTYMRTFMLLKKYMEMKKFKLWFLLGNHDLWYAQRWNVSSVYAFSALPNIEIIDSVCQKKIAGSLWDFIPYTHDPISAVQELAKNSHREYCLAHIALHGAKLNSAGTHSDVVIEHDGDMVVVDKNIFSGYKHVYLGHYHSAQNLCHNVEYIGSPLQLSFGEAFEPKWIIDLNCKTNEKEYIENTFSPKHLYIKQHDLEKYDLENNFVTVITDDISATDVVQMRTELMKNNKLGSLQIRQNERRKEDDNIIRDAKAILLKEDELIDKYLDEVGTAGLDKTNLRIFGKKIMEKQNV